MRHSEDNVRETFGKVRMSDKKTDSILQDILNYSEEKAEHVKEREEGAVAEKEIKPKCRGKISVKLAALGSAAIIVILAGIIIYAGIHGINDNNEISVGSGDNSTDTNQNEGSLTGTVIHKYLVRTEYDSQTGKYLLYTSKEKVSYEDSEKNISTIIEVDQDKIFKSQYNNVLDKEYLLNLNASSDVWIHVDFDGTYTDEGHERVTAGKVVVDCHGQDGKNIGQTDLDDDGVKEDIWLYMCQEDDWNRYTIIEGKVQGEKVYSYQFSELSSAETEFNYINYQGKDCLMLTSFYTYEESDFSDSVEQDFGKSVKIYGYMYNVFSMDSDGMIKSLDSQTIKFNKADVTSGEKDAEALKSELAKYYRKLHEYAENSSFLAGIHKGEMLLELGDEDMKEYMEFEFLREFERSYINCGVEDSIEFRLEQYFAYLEENDMETTRQYVYRVEYNENTDSYLFYTGTEKKNHEDSRDYVDNVITVNGNAVFDSSMARITDREYLTGLDELSDMWIEIEFNGLVLETYPAQIIAAKVILDSEN